MNQQYLKKLFHEFGIEEFDVKCYGACEEFVNRHFHKIINAMNKLQCGQTDTILNENDVSLACALTSNHSFHVPQNYNDIKVMATKINSIKLPETPNYDGIVLPIQEECMAADEFQFITLSEANEKKRIFKDMLDQSSGQQLPSQQSSVQPKQFMNASKQKKLL